MKTLATIIASIIMTAVLFVNSASAKTGIIEEITPGGVKLTVLDEDGNTVTVLNKGRQFEVKVGAVVEFENMGNGNGKAPVSATNVLTGTIGF